MDISYIHLFKSLDNLRNKLQGPVAKLIRDLPGLAKVKLVDVLDSDGIFLYVCCICFRILFLENWGQTARMSAPTFLIWTDIWCKSLNNEIRFWLYVIYKSLNQHIFKINDANWFKDELKYFAFLELFFAKLYFDFPVVE